MSKTLVLYVFHMYNERVRAFINDCIFYDKNIDFMIISNEGKTRPEIPGDVFDNVNVLYRKNIGYDFGGWSEALLTNNQYKGYDNFIFVNSSVVGPFLRSDFKGKWTDIYINGLQDNIRLFGSTINTMENPLVSSHVQSYIFSMNKDTLEYLIKSEIFSTTTYAKDFDEAIDKKEILMSRKIIENNWNIGSLLSYYKGVDFTFRDKQPEEYKIKFLDDIMYEKYRGVLWDEYELVFVKGNRINIQTFPRSTEEGFSNFGAGKYTILLILFSIFIFTFIAIVSSNYLKVRIKTIWKKIERKSTGYSRILWYVIFIVIFVYLYYYSVVEGFSSEKNNPRLVFYIPHYKSEEKDSIVLSYCVRGIQLHYPDSDIIICKSHSAADNLEYDISGVIWIDNPIPNSSSIGCFKDYLLRYKGLNTKGIFMNDNMILKGEFVKERLNRDFGFIWMITSKAKNDIKNSNIKEYADDIMRKYEMKSDDYVGCLGNGVYGTYESIQKLWDTVPFESFMEYKDRKNVMQDTERVIGIVAFAIGLISSIDKSSLCGDIDKMPNAFMNVYTGQTFDELQQYPYSEACVKLWGLRTEHMQ